MRVVGGEFRSRKLEAPPGEDTRPTLDQVREAVFASLGGRFEGGALLDPFAGSGAIGIEALSRGMDSALLADRDPAAVEVMRRNVSSLGLQKRAEIWQRDYHKTLRLLGQRGRKFDCIYLDPPYRLGKFPEIFGLIGKYGLLEEKGIIVAESLKKEVIDGGEYCMFKESAYGIMKVSYFVKKQGL